VGRWRALRDRLNVLLETLVFLNLAFLNLRLLNHLTMTTALPFADERLDAWDRALGFDWIGCFEFVRDRPLLIRLFDRSYASLTSLSILAVLILIGSGHLPRARFFLETFFVTAFLSILIGAFFPAEAAVAFLLKDPSAYRNFPVEPGIYHISHLQSLRAAGGEILLRPSILPGLVTFPSFHAAAGIIPCTAFFGTWAFWPVLFYSAVMIGSTPIFGGHYIVDLVAGIILAVGVLTSMALHRRHRSVFAARPRAA